MRLPILAPLFAFFVTLVSAQSVPPHGHITDAAKMTFAFVHATVHVDARTVFADATLLVRDGKVVACGNKVSLPKDAAVRDLTGLHLWPALIDPYSDLGMVWEKEEDRPNEIRGARHWNGALRADAHANELLDPDEEAMAKLREQGFGTVFTHRMDGLAQGTSAALLLTNGPLPKAVLQPQIAAHFSLRKGSSPDPYPNSQMGAIALLRQTFLDARWVAAQERPSENDAVLQEIARQLQGRMVVAAEDRNEVLRWATLLNEFQLAAIVKGAGDEYARLASIRATGLPMILPVLLPEAYDVEDPYDAQEVSFARMKHWEMAPRNAAMLDTAGVRFAFTPHGRKDMKDFWKDLRRMVSFGLDSARAIEALTTDPARLFGLDDQVGALREGMVANFLITSHHLLHEKNSIHETWVQGQRYMHSDAHKVALQGTYELNLGDAIWNLEVTEKEKKVEATVRRAQEADSLRTKAELQVQGNLVTVVFAPRKEPQSSYRLSGTVHGNGGLWDGQGQRPGGQWFAWSAIRQATKKATAKPDSTRRDTVMAAGPLTKPLVGFGWIDAPVQTTTIFRDATVWTNTEKGILRNTDVCIHEGKVKAVGEDLDVALLFPGKQRPTIVEVNAKGKHLTCGIVDEHSHIAISRGVNEGTQPVTAHVRIGDVVNPDDINIYRNLAGGVTTVQLLHGSANPIGGQSALIKLRWGHAADSLLIRDAPRHIKFALGENVKQSNWGVSDRFPQTRMGVEQVYYEAFHRAREYDTEWSLWNTRKPKDRGPAPRRELVLDALAEILRGERHISCHSYVQSEIDMLLHVADSMYFKVNTFTHILEGYKMSAKMKAHGVNASTFSDWWGYKFEVNEAIPYNAALLHNAGVLTGINSDDAEMSRRLNQEAAKAVKYGGVSEEEAWKMVTLNPARMLRLDHRLGSIATGMDADVVLWSTNPLSIDAKAEQTYVDGVKYFDAALDVQQRQWVSAERDRLVRAMIAAKRNGAETRKPERDTPKLWHCDDLGDGTDHAEDLEP